METAEGMDARLRSKSSNYSKRSEIRDAQVGQLNGDVSILKVKTSALSAECNRLRRDLSVKELRSERATGKLKL